MDPMESKVLKIKWSKNLITIKNQGKNWYKMLENGQMTDCV